MNSDRITEEVHDKNAKTLAGIMVIVITVAAYFGFTGSKVSFRKQSRI